MKGSDGGKPKKGAISAPHSTAVATAPAGTRLPPLPGNREKPVIKSKPAKQPNFSPAKPQLAPIPSSSNSQLVSNTAKKKEADGSESDVIELGAGTAVPTQADADTFRVVTTIISLNLNDLAPIKPIPKSVPLKTVFDVSERKLMRIPIKELQNLLDCIHDGKQFTPLVIDPTGRVEVFFTYAGEALIVDCKKILVQCDLQKVVSIEEAKETLRQAVVAGLKFGKTIVFAMLNSAFAFKKYIDDSYFPASVLEQGGTRFRQDVAAYEKCLRPADYDRGIFVVNEDWPFRIVLTSNFELEDYEEFLASSVTLANMMPIYIEPAGSK
ncbi:hypothetical protein HDU81_002740 [Chytriomyces hyalinus]|nr:hypothetical protein HDU81_002740 [Chytriomyces hyalinus]